MRAMVQRRARPVGYSLLASEKWIIKVLVVQTIRTTLFVMLTQIMNIQIGNTVWVAMRILVTL